jgi:biopolymer transport protein ExbD
MSAGGGSNQDFELNIASIIDCFTVLITYILVSASFISLGVLTVTVASVSEASTPEPEIIEPEAHLSVLIQSDQSLTLQIESQDVTQNAIITIPIKNGQKDLDALSEQLSEMKERFHLDNVLVSGADDVAYKHLVAVVAQVEKILPHVALSAEGI